MKDREHDRLLAEGRERYLSLLNQATNLLSNLDTLSPAGLTEAVQRRQEVVEQLQDFDGRLSELGTEREEAQAEFRRFREETTRKILELDALLIGLARDKQAAIKETLSARGRSKSASQAYGTGTAGKRPLWLNDTV